jgi:hypothetical protein
MRTDLKTLLEKLGVNHVLSPYETHPWFFYDEGRGLTCSAEVRMGPSGDDVEAEIQFLYDEGREPEETETATEGETSSETGGATTSPKMKIIPGVPFQILRMRAIPIEGFWSPKELRVKGEDYKNKIYDWEGKGCNFFRACVEALAMSEIPNIDELIDRELDDDDGFGGKKGRIGRKAPKIKPAQLLGMKKGI